MGSALDRTDLDHGAIAWPGQIDLAPDAMYQGIKAKGVLVLT